MGPLSEYIGCKIDVDDIKSRIKIAQPVLVQIFVDEYELDGHKPTTPAEPGKILVKCEARHELSAKLKKIYRSGIGKLLYLMRWSRPDVLNSVRELSKFMINPGPAHLIAMYQVMNYIVASRDKGLVLAPKQNEHDNQLEVMDMSDSNYATDPDNRKSVSGFAYFNNSAAV